MKKDEQYDADRNLKRLFDIKQKQRAAAKEYFQNFIYNPHRPVNDGLPFDPAMQRFSAMSAYHIEYFRPTPKIYAGFLLFVSPIFLLTYFMHTTRSKLEEQLRAGEISYHDRKFKLIF